MGWSHLKQFCTSFSFEVSLENFHGRLPTDDVLMRRGFLLPSQCRLCCKNIETLHTYVYLVLMLKLSGIVFQLASVCIWTLRLPLWIFSSKQYLFL